VVRSPLLCKMTFSCPIRPSRLSRNVLYSVGTGGHFCGNYTSNDEVNVTGPSISVVANAWRYTSIAHLSTNGIYFIVGMKEFGLPQFKAVILEDCTSFSTLISP